MAVLLGPEKPILTRAIEVARVGKYVQFGQTHDDAAWDGMTACTHAVCQYLAKLWRDKDYTINEVNSIAGMPYRAHNTDSKHRIFPRGMNNLEFQRFCDRVGIPMEVRFGLSYETVLRWSNNAPVFYGMLYESAPTWKGYHYAGLTATPPFAIEAGRTQLGSRVGRHAVTLLGYRSVLGANGQPIAYRQWELEPNHGSDARPERPPFHIVTTAQGKKEYNDYLQKAQKTYCALPTRKLAA